jgi:hypothetical protein
MPVSSSLPLGREHRPALVSAGEDDRAVGVVVDEVGEGPVEGTAKFMRVVMVGTIL